VHAFVLERALGWCQLLEDVPRMGLDRLRGDVEPLCDTSVGEALGHQAQHLAFSRSQLVERIGAPSPVEQLCDECRVDDHSAGENPRDRVGQMGCIKDAVFEQVADTSRAGVSRSADMTYRGDQPSDRAPAPTPAQRGCLNLL
jgi:hypothetical protein